MHRATRLATILGTAGRQGRLEAAIGATNATCKYEPLRGDVGCCPSLALRHPCCPIYPRHFYLPKGAKGAGSDAQPVCGSTDDPTAQ